MWRILRKTGIAPDIVKSAEDDDLMQPHAGVGFTDVGWGIPGTDRSVQHSMADGSSTALDL